MKFWKATALPMNENRMETYFSIRYEFDRERVFQRMDGVLRSGGKGYICVADGHVLSEVQRNREYRKVLGGALLTICDSGWVPVYLKWLLHADRPQYCGAQIFHDVIAMKKYRMMFLGGTRDTLDALRRTLVREDPRVGYMPFEELPFCAADEFDYGAIAARINEYLPDIIWISLGAPKQEVFMNRLCPHLQRGIMVAVGAVFHFAAGGRIRRAPDWMVACKLEFLYRIFNEPRKQMKRCWKIISVLPWIFIREKQRQKAARPGASSGWGGETPRLPCTLVSCFGQVPGHMGELLESWGREKDRKFIIISDDAGFWNLPPNARLVPMAFCELQRLVRIKLGRRHNVKAPEDLPPLLPEYPVLFEDYVGANRELEAMALEAGPGSSEPAVPSFHR